MSDESVVVDIKTVDTKTIDTSRDAIRYGRRNYRKSIGVDNRRHWNGSFVSKETVVEAEAEEPAVADEPVVVSEAAAEATAEYQPLDEKVIEDLHAGEDAAAIDAVTQEPEADAFPVEPDAISAPATEAEKAAYDDFSSPLNANISDDTDVAATSDEE